MNKDKKEFWGMPFLCFLFVMVFCNIFAYFYVTESRFIYCWDNTLFWSAARSLADYKVDFEYFKMLYKSFGESEYNMLPTILPALVMKIFGKSRLVFIQSVVNLYFLPAVLMIFIISKKFAKKNAILPALTVISLPVMLFTCLVGFLDMGAVFISLLAMYMWLGFEKHEKTRAVLTGILLVVSMLFRRYFAFFSLSFVVAALGEKIISHKRKTGAVLMGATVGIILVLFFREFLVNQLLKNYASLYSGYKFNINVDLKLITRYFGIIPLLLLFILSVFKFKNNKNSIFLFLWIQLFLCFFMFVSTQTHGQQHLLLYVSGIIMLIILCFGNEDSVCIKLFYSFIAVLIFANTLILRQQPEGILNIKHLALIPDFSMRPRIREDADEILNLKKYLNKIVEREKKVGILASGLQFNEDILRNCEISLGEKEEREDFILNLPCVDSRDKDLTALFEVDYIVVANPVQTHLGEERQQITVNAAECFFNNEGFARAFFKMDTEFEISGMTIYVYKKIRDIRPEEKDEFINKIM